MRRNPSVVLGWNVVALVLALGWAGCAGGSIEPIAGAGGAGGQKIDAGGGGGPTGGTGGTATDGGGGGDVVRVDGRAGAEGGGTSALDPCGFPVAAAGSAIVVENLPAGVTVPHQLVLLQGKTTTSVPALSVNVGESTLDFKTAGTAFKAIVLLKPGLNHVGMAAAGHKPLCFPISWKEPVNTRTVRMVFHAASDSDGTTFARVPGSRFADGRQCLPGETCDNATVAKRVEFIGLIHQLAMAELLVAAGMPRKTFSLRRDSDGQLVTALFRSTRTMAQLLTAARNGGDPANQKEWYALDSAAEEVERSERALGEDSNLTKLIIVFADLQAGAWGGPPVGASFGGGEFYSWAADVPQLMQRLYDDRALSALNLEPDGGPTVRRTFATTVGASLHELGHTFNFQHVSDMSCEIMNRGFDFFDSLFRPELPLKMCWTRDNDGDDHAKLLDSSPWIRAAP